MFSCCQDCPFVCILLYTLTSLVLKLQRNCAVDLLCADVEIVSDISESSPVSAVILICVSTSLRIAWCSLHLLFNHRPPSFSGRCCGEHSAAELHVVGAVTDRF